MGKISKIEYDKRIFAVQGWIIEGIQPALIIKQIIDNGWCQKRQAERYLREARKRWLDVPEADLEDKRKLKVNELQQLKRTLKERFKGTPSGIRAVLEIEKQIIILEKLKPAKQVEVSGKDGNPIEVENTIKGELTLDPSKLKTETIEEILNAQTERK